MAGSISEPQPSNYAKLHISYKLKNDISNISISMAIQRGNASCVISTVPVPEGLD